MTSLRELRLNNWVYSLEIGKYVQIASIDSECITLKDHVTWDYVYADMIEPIPLTEEILLKCGFIIGMRLQDFLKGKYSFVEIKGGIVYGEFSEEGVFYFNSKTQLKYLHQLQNLCFALTGEELKIEL